MVRQIHLPCFANYCSCPSPLKPTYNNQKNWLDMKFIKTKNLLLISIAAATSTHIQATNASDSLQMNLDLRSFYMNRDFDQGIPDTDVGGQAFRISASSPYYADLIGFNLASTQVLALRSGDGRNMSNVLADQGDSYATVEDAYIKLRPFKNLNLHAGRMVMATPLLNSQRSRLSAGSVQAVYADLSIKQFSLYGFFADEASLATSQDFTPYSRNGKEYAISSIGAAYQLSNGLSLQAQLASADDYLKQTYLNLSFPTRLFDNSLMLDATHMRGADNGDLYGRDYNSHLTSLTGRLTTGNLTYTLNYQTIGGDDAYALKWGGQDDTQYYTYGSVQLLDFNARDEQSLQFRIDYDVPSIPGLHLMARHTEAWDIDTTTTGNAKRRETNFDVKYAVTSGKAKGLNTRVRLAHATGDAVAVPRISDIRLIVDYPFSLL